MKRLVALVFLCACVFLWHDGDSSTDAHQITTVFPTWLKESAKPKTVAALSRLMFAGVSSRLNGSHQPATTPMRGGHSASGF